MAEPKNQMLQLTERLSILSISETVTKNVVIPMLDEQSVHALTLSCKHYRSQFKDKYADKKVAADMLHCVLNPTLPNQARFLALLSSQKRDKNGQPFYLIQNHGEEVYFNKAGVKKTKTIRYSTNVLEAILRTKNFHLAKTLFNCIPEHEKTKNLKEYISVVKSRNIWGMPELQIAYNTFLRPWQALYDAINECELHRLSGYALNRLSGYIGQVQKERLPWFSLYLFCHPGTHANADYTKAPNWSCILRDFSELDLDEFGGASILALSKGGTDKAAGRSGSSWRNAPRVIDERDARAFARQCDVLQSELDKTIKLYDLDEPKPSSTKLTFE